MLVSDRCKAVFGENAGYYGVVTMLVVFYLLNMVNAFILSKRK